MNGQRGGAAILLAFLLLTLMAALGFATCRNLDRELATVGEAARGAGATAAAESGLAWFLARSAGGADPASLAAPPEGLLDAGPEAGLLRFELRIRCLGALGRPGAEPGEEPAERLWRVTAIGRWGVPGLDQGEFIQVRELLAAGPREPDRPGPLRILAWSVPP